MRIKLIRAIRKPPWPKAWSGITAVALTIALVLTFLPVEVGVNTDGTLSIGLRQASANPGWLTGWSYRKAINITGQSDAGSNYTVTLHLGESSGSSGYNFTVGNHCTDFPSIANDDDYDIAWTDDNETTELNAYIRTVTGTAPNRTAEFRVTVSDNLSSNQTIYCYYGSNTQSSASNGTATFLFFDDFSGEVSWGLSWNDSYRLADYPTWHTDYLNVGQVVGNYCFYAAMNDNAVGVLNITDPNNVTEVDYISCSTAHDIHVQGDVACVVGYTSNTLYTFNVSDVTNITALDSIGIGDVGMYLWYDGTYCYVTTKNADWLKIYDVSNPADITYAGGISGASAHLNEPWHVQVAGDYAYVTSHLTPYDGITIINVSNPSIPVYSDGIYDGTGEHFSLDFRIINNGNNLIAGSYNSTVPEDIYVYNITNGGANITQYSGSDVSYGCGGHFDISGDYLYSRDGPSDDGISVIDISDLSNLTYVSNIYGSGSPYYMSGCHWLQVVGNTCYAFAYLTDTFVILDAGYSESFEIDTDKWNVYDSSSNVAGELNLVGEDSWTTGGVISKTSLARPVMFEWDSRQSAASGIDACIVYSPSVNVHLGSEWYQSYTGYWRGRDPDYGDWTTAQITPVTATKHWGIGICPTSGSDYYYEGRIKGDESVSNHDNWYLLFNMYSSASWIKVDNVFARKYVYPEPAFSSAGGEEEEEGCSPNYYIAPSGWNINGGNPVSESSNYATGLTYFTVTNNNSGGAIDITISGSDMTGGGYTWDLADNGSPGDMIYGLYAGLSGGDYTIIVKESAPYNTLVSSLANNDAQDFGLKIYTPTNFDDGNDKSGGITLTVVCS